MAKSRSKSKSPTKETVPEDQPITAEQYERLGAFYLGREYDMIRKKADGPLVMYDSKDLVTHGVVLGMTGSGKTGLCVGILEEAAIDGIPSIIVDPKGDITNLLLTFPNLSAEEFRPWINEEEARRAGRTPDEYAQDQAELWEKGIGSWGQDAGRIRRLRDTVDMAIYTPASSAGLGVSLLASFEPPPFETLDDPEALGELIESTVTSLLALIGIEADPVRSREHILLSNIFNHAWQAGEKMDIPAMIKMIQKPPFATLGVVDVDSFFPKADRFALSMMFNNMLASPGFAAWLRGEPLDIQRMLYGREGKPRVAIFSIAHLNDAERMFFVSLLFNRTVTWMRSQPGTTSLRALLYMDEIFGFLPPTSNPPSKKPLMTMLKQARAFGLGVLLASQNPVDLDYKALSNIGTWFLGRLQTERDKSRVMDGLKGAAATQEGGFDQERMEELLAGLGKRVFLMNNVHEDGPTVFHVRWVLSYLRGPLTRGQIKKLMDPLRDKLSTVDTKSAGSNESTGAINESGPARQTRRSASRDDNAHGVGSPTSQFLLEPPRLHNSVEQLFGPGKPNSDGEIVYRPYIFRHAEVYFHKSGTAIDETREFKWVNSFDAELKNVNWDEVHVVTPEEESQLSREPSAGAHFLPLTEEYMDRATYTRLAKEFEDYLYGSQKIELFEYSELGISSEPGEGEADFRLRIAQSVREVRDTEIEKLRKKYEPKFAALEKKLRTAEKKVSKEKQEADSKVLDTILDFGGNILENVLSGDRKKGKSRGIDIGLDDIDIKEVGKTREAWKRTREVSLAKDQLEDLQQEWDYLENELRGDAQVLKEKYDPLNVPVEKVVVKPYKKNITIKALGLIWWPEED